MVEQASQALYRLTYDEGGAFGLESFADTIILDASTAPPTICALRMGGEPEQVQAMASIIQGGGTITAELDGERQKLVCLEWAYRRQLSRSGPYTHATFVASELPITSPKQEKQEQKGTKTEQPQAMEPEQPKPEDSGPEVFRMEETDELPPRKLFFYTNAGDRDALFSAIDAKTAVPLTPGFRDFFLEQLEFKSHLRQLKVYTQSGVDMDAWVLQCEKSDTNLIQVVETGLSLGEITIPEANYGPEVAEGINSVQTYLDAFGLSIAERIRERFVPLFDPASEPLCPELIEVSNYICAHAGYHLYDAQMAVAEAAARQHRRGKCALIVAECGIGKCAKRS